MADRDRLAAEVSEALESVGLLVIGLKGLKEALSVQTELISQILSILTAEPEGPSPLEDALRNIHGILRAMDERLERIERAMTG